MENEEMVYMRKELEQQVSRGEAVQRLLEDKDFKQIILEYYFKDTMIGLGHQMSTQHKPEIRQAISEQILARGILQNFLNMMLDDANRAATELREIGA